MAFMKKDQKEELNNILELILDCKIRVVNYSKKEILLNNNRVLVGKELSSFFTIVKRAKQGHIGLTAKNVDVVYGYDDELKKAIKKQISFLNTRWKNKSPWNKGLTKETDKRLLESSKRMLTNENPSIKYGYSNNTKIKQSITMKRMILEGSFTPNSNNRLCFKKINYNGKNYRSSWEVCFAQINPEYEYETFRLLYNKNNKSTVYIVDFICHTKKIVVEIKPKNIMRKEVNLVKENALKEWCIKNNYEYQWWNEDTFKEKYHLLNLSELPEIVVLRIKGLNNEINKKN